MKTKLPFIKDIAAVAKHVKRYIDNDYRAYEDDETPGILLTIGASPDGSWDYQTGDNSYSGGAYMHPHWGVAAIYRRSNCVEVARDIVSQIADVMD